MAVKKIHPLLNVLTLLGARDRWVSLDEVCSRYAGSEKSRHRVRDELRQAVREEWEHGGRRLISRSGVRGGYRLWSTRDERPTAQGELLEALRALGADEHWVSTKEISDRLKGRTRKSIQKGLVRLGDRVRSKRGHGYVLVKSEGE